MGTRNIDLRARCRDEVVSESAFCYMNICKIRDSLFLFKFLLTLSAYPILPLFFLFTLPGAQVKSACPIIILALSST